MSHVHAKVVKNIKNVVDVNVEKTPVEPFAHWCFFLYSIHDQGKEYLDFFAGVSVMNCGHCNLEILEKTIQQMQTLQHTTIIYLTEEMVQLAEKLASVLPGDLRRSFFCCTGSEANEGAMLLARLYTGKNEFIALENGLHGRTYLTMSATGIPMWRADPDLSPKVHFAKTVWDSNTDLEQAAKASIESIKEIIQARGANHIAALIAEPIQGNGGIITPPAWYFKELKQLLEDNRILLIIDEVQTGFARTGKMFAIEHYDVVPDIMTVAKALGNGMPISAFCTTDEVAKAFTKPSASTLGGNPVSSATALAVLDYIEKYELCETAAHLGEMLKEGLIALQAKYSLIKDVRGIGLMLGAELVKRRTTRFRGNGCHFRKVKGLWDYRWKEWIKWKCISLPTATSHYGSKCSNITS